MARARVEAILRPPGEQSRRFTEPPRVFRVPAAEIESLGALESLQEAQFTRGLGGPACTPTDGAPDDPCCLACYRHCGDRDAGEAQMSEVRILVNNVPPEGWRWRLVAGGNTLKSGSAKTEAEAHGAANAALRRLQEENRPTDTD